MLSLLKLEKTANINDTAIRLLDGWGIETALVYIFTQISFFRPIKQLHCNLRKLSTRQIFNVAEVGTGEKVTTYSHPDTSLAYNISHEASAAYFMNNMETDPLYGRLYTPAVPYRSLVRFPLFWYDDYICVLGCWAELPNSFEQDDVDILQRLFSPFGEHFLRCMNANPEEFIKKPSPRLRSSDLLSMCPELKLQVTRMKKVAATSSTVLITGESGTGKSVMAYGIHEMSERARKPFISVNCGAIPENLLGSQLFGHEKGSFTGAVSSHKGYFEQANGGTIFLDEIGELPLLSQVHLLQVLDTHEIVRVGGTQRIPLDIHVIAATNKDLKQMVKKGLFREDLYFRLSVYPIDIPPLRERKKDIYRLLRYYLLVKSTELGIQSIISPSKAEFQHFFNYSWPGNVRELEHVVERALLDAQQGKAMGNLHFNLGSGELDTNRETLPSERENPELLTGSLDDTIRSYMCKVLKQTNGQIYGPEGAAAVMRVHPNTVKSKMIKYGIKLEKQTVAE